MSSAGLALTCIIAVAAAFSIDWSMLQLLASNLQAASIGGFD